MLVDQYRERLAALPRTPSLGGKRKTLVTFDRDNIPAPPDVIQDDLVSIEVRNIHESWGLVDNIVIRLDRTQASALGLWLIAGAVHAPDRTYRLDLLNPSSAIKTVSFIPQRPDYCGVRYTIENFVWRPAELEGWEHESHRYLNQKPRLMVTNAADVYNSRDEYFARDVLSGFGPPGGVCLLAEFFLNFGLESCNLNYDQIKYRQGPNIADADSCEARVELRNPE
jgi:hypothetical protein